MGEKVDRRNYLKYAAAGIVVVAGGAAGAYYATKPPSEATTTTLATSELKARGIFEVTPISDELQKLVPDFEQETGIKFTWESYAYDAYIERE